MASSRDSFPSETVVSFRWTLTSAKLFNRESPANFPHGFLTKFPQRGLIHSPSESPSERITTTLFLVFSKTSFRQEPSQQILLAVTSTVYSSEFSQKITSNFWCVYFPSKLSTTQQINIHPAGCLFKSQDISPIQTLIYISTCCNALSIQCQ